MVTIKQIAERAGVSTATVSNVIHGKIGKVSPETIQRIQRLIDEMGYVRNEGPTVPQASNSKLVAVIVHTYHPYDNTVLADPFYGVVVGNIEEELRQHGYYMMFYASQDMEEIFQMLKTWNVDGVVAVSFSIAECGKLHSLLRKPVISIDAYGKPDEAFLVPNIGLDDEMGGYLMVNHLLEVGYENVFMMSMDNIGIDHRRWIGAQRVCDTQLFLGGKKRLEYIQLGLSRPERETRYREIARQIPFKRKTAFFFTSDQLAMEAIRHLSEFGVKVPEDVGVAGFDNTISAANFSIPRLTTISQDMEMKARLAVQGLTAMIEDQNYQPKSRKLPVHLVIRQSV